MEEKQKVFIRGRKGYGKEIVKILEGLGAKAMGLRCNADDCIYFIDHENGICATHSDSEMSQVIMDNYREIELPAEQWKDGDILVSRSDSFKKEFVVFEKMRSEALFSHYPLFKGDSTMLLLASDYRKALSKEVRMFKDLLASHGQEWDEEQKRVVRKVYRPNRGELYYRVLSSGNIVSDYWGRDPAQLDDLHFGNCFKTRMEAERAARDIRALLLDPDFGTGEREK